MTSKKALVIDGNSLMYRMFYATKNLSDYAIMHNIIPVNAVKLMLETCLKLRNQNYDYCLVAFDYGKKTFRHEQFKNYKDGRHQMPTELVNQIPLIKQSLEMIGFVHVALQDYEADDLIGTFCNLMSKNEIHVDVYSSDKDMLQLVNKYTYVHLIKSGLTNIVINTADNFANLNNGLSPSQIIDYKAIVGDKSDNICGIKGVGEKTGIELLIKYQTFDNIYANLESLSKSLQTKFLDSKKEAEMFKKIIAINCNVNFDLFNEINNFKINSIDIESLKKFLSEYKINNLEKYLITEQTKLF
ncbi:MAG: 5'-3' exonuclease [Ureaplasma sp.]|nr:5'-3' exonuclease [Ureaplasma sp.]